MEIENQQLVNIVPILDAVSTPIYETKGKAHTAPAKTKSNIKTKSNPKTKSEPITTLVLAPITLVVPDGEIYFRNDEGDEQVLEYGMIYEYVESICQKMGVPHLNVTKVTNDVYPKLKTFNTITEIEDQIVMTVSNMVTDHYDYSAVAMWILISNLHAQTHDDYVEVVKQLFNNVSKTGELASIVTQEFVDFVIVHRNAINAALNYARDYEMSVFGYRTLENAYLKRTTAGFIIERPQHLYMRVAIAIHRESKNIDRVIETYDHMSQGYFTHATPTLFNAGTLCQQMSSCFLLSVDDDMGSITKCWGNCAMISKFSGGIGLCLTSIRASGAYIKSTQGYSNGLKVTGVYDAICNYANQGGRRPGSNAVYIEPWHADTPYFIELKKNTGAETERTRNLFTALMVNDIFMERVEQDGIWSFMCPASCPNLLNKYGDDFSQAYIDYENRGVFVKQIKARDLWFKIMEVQIESGMPYIIYKDAANRKSNQKNIGVINCSNLCAEILQFSSNKEYGVCNLASICLPKFVTKTADSVSYDYQKLYEVARMVTRNLNNVIDVNYYPVKAAKRSNMKHRPIGIGPQGLADVFALFRTPFGSKLSRDLNKKIFETIYFGALTESCLIARETRAYRSFNGSPMSKGEFQFNLWGLSDTDLSGMWDWAKLRLDIIKYGIANSLTTCCMPTASTSQIMGNNECIEPYTENIYIRTTNAGEFFVINKHLMRDLMEQGLWNEDVPDLIKYYKGSIASIPGIPDDIKQIYRTVWETPQKSIIKLAAERGPFIDQTQSMNIFIAKASYPALTSCLFYAWKRGLKTGMYYLRTKTASNANQFGIDIDKIKALQAKYQIEEADVEKTLTLAIEPSSPTTQACRFIPGRKFKPGECTMCSS